MNPRGGKTSGTVQPHVFDALVELGEATPSAVHKHLNGRFTLKQVQGSMWGACNAKRLISSGPQRNHSGGARESSYRLAIAVPEGGFVAAGLKRFPVDLFKPNRRDLRNVGPAWPSVWHYAEGRGIRLVRRDSTRAQGSGI